MNKRIFAFTIAMGLALSMSTVAFAAEDIFGNTASKPTETNTADVAPPNEGTGASSAPVQNMKTGGAEPNTPLLLAAGILGAGGVVGVLSSRKRQNSEENVPEGFTL